MILPLRRPLIFFDLETTGTSVTDDRIVQMAVLKVAPDGDRKAWKQFFNPEQPIAPEATAVHGISDDDVRDAPTFRSMAHKLHRSFSSGDLAGYNHLHFDVPLLAEEFARCDLVFPAPDVRYVDVYRIFRRRERRTLEAAHQFFLGREMEHAHDAMADVVATLDVFEAQLDRYGDLPRDLDQLHSYCQDDCPAADAAGKLIRDKEGEVRFNFGKHRGERVLDHPEYAAWMLRGDFARSTKVILRQLLGGLKVAV
ncbi:MAG: 3'-5' exonuclease [Catalinimonas sp.]